VTLGLGALPSEQPPALYAYDPDVGRLAVTTPTYSTAVTVVDRERLPYGGAELARLFDGDMRVAAGIGGRPPASFGVVARRSGRTVTSQHGRPRGSLRRPPLRLAGVPRPVAYPRRPYAGPFRTLEAEVVTRDEALTITTRHRFRPDHIETRWTIEARRRWTVEVLFPSTGADATITAHRGWFHVASTEAGYVIVPLGDASRFRLIRPTPQDSAPNPGPTLAIRLRLPRFAVRIAPASAAEAALVAARLQRR
jgi:hypothetical protein